MTAYLRPLPTYIERTAPRRVQALKIKAVIPNPRGYELHFEDERFCPTQHQDDPLNSGWVSLQKRVDAGLYLVVWGIFEDAFMDSAEFEARFVVEEPNKFAVVVDAVRRLMAERIYDEGGLAGGVSPVFLARITSLAVAAGVMSPGNPIAQEAAEMFAGEGPAPEFGHMMDFGDAIRALKSGKKVARAGWNGKGMWLSLSAPASTGPFVMARSISSASFWSENNRAFAEENGGFATVLPCITMKTATGEILMGWLASQSDMLAVDWVVVP